MVSGRVWFITGASSGFGRLMTELVLKKGDTVVATLRTPEAIADLSSRLRAGRAHFGRIDVVFNNAGYALFGEAEGMPDKLARDAMEVDFWGAANVSREALRVFREVNAPMGGFLCRYPPAVASSASQGCPTTVRPNTALAGELNPEWNIKVCLVEPGGFRTAALSRMIQAPPHAAYMPPASATWRERERSKGIKCTPNMADPAKAIEMMYKVSSLSDPPLQIPLGKDCLSIVRSTVTKLQQIVETYAPWSDELEPEGEYWESLAN
ncbi:NAD(P)-binding protein [Daedalea quercina L-15889]|uniref:NAD(P)-binding protein n=1 Tax=Daedalea quercina L-15889 TaxID=1314783 RepID=A0A165U7X9_9APHY|nr:NAD(P)-binding protein [Daedalea quercina L-15889]